MEKFDVVNNSVNGHQTEVVINCQDGNWYIMDRPIGTKAILPQTWPQRLLVFVLSEDCDGEMLDAYLSKSTAEIEKYLTSINNFEANQDEPGDIKKIQEIINNAPKVTGQDIKDNGY